MGGAHLARKDYPTQKDWGYDKRKKNHTFEKDNRKEKDRRKKDSERRRSKRRRDNYYDDED